MSTAIKRKSKTLSLGIAALAASLVLGAAATPAFAGDDRHRGWDGRGGWERGWDGGHRGHHHVPPGHAKKHHHGYYAPVYVYAPPPPVVYVPARPVYAAPSPGLTIVFPIDLN